MARTRLNFILFAIGCVLMTGAALIDLVFGLGWGFEWREVLTGIGLGAAGVVVYLICKAIFRIFRD